MKLFAALIAVLFATTAVAEETYDDFIGVVINPAIPPADAYEVFTGRIERGLTNDYDGIAREACIVHLEPREMPAGEPFPLDEDGRPKIMLDDGMTFVSVDELIAMIDARYCIFVDPNTGDVT